MNKEALKLPDALLVRYYRAEEIERIEKVTTLKNRRIRVKLSDRTDLWRDLGGGLGYVPDAD